MQLGNQTLYWRAYSQYIGSVPSVPVAYGTPAIAVVGGGASGPTPQPSTGSGVLSNGLLRGGRFRRESGLANRTGSTAVKVRTSRMRIREYGGEDLAALRAIHAA